MHGFCIYFIIILGVLIALNIALAALVLRLKKRLDAFLKNGNQDIGAVLAEQIQKLRNQEKISKEIFDEIARLQRISSKSLQKIGIKRYSPFPDVGGDQSFSIVLLDSKNNGFIMTSHFGRDFNRVYAKPISKGECRYSLSQKEKETIAEAMKE